jgi:hypothetical protein
MPLPGSDHRQYEGSYAPYQTDMWTGYAGEVRHAREAEDQLMQFIFENKHKLREISLRMVLKIADLWKMAPDRYQHLAESDLHEAGLVI